MLRIDVTKRQIVVLLFLVHRFGDVGLMTGDITISKSSREVISLVLETTVTHDLISHFSFFALTSVCSILQDPTATCLVMTTEILRSMLYRGSELMREVAWVIYDEVHYMRDSERGVVWEESIVLLPHRVRFVFLSATIPNASQFADWICEIHHQPCHVVYTNYRPVPLQVRKLNSLYDVSFYCG